MDTTKECRTRIALELEPGEALAVIGAKASGKTTLCRLVASIPVKRELQRVVLLNGLERPGPEAAPTVHLLDMEEAGHLVPNLSVAENIFLDRHFTGSLGRINWCRLHNEAGDLLIRLGVKGIDCDADIKALSLIQKLLLVVCKHYARGVRVFIIDELTKFLSLMEAEVLLDTLKALKTCGASLVYVPYRIEELPSIADKVVILSKGGIPGPSQALASISYEQIINVMMGHEQEASAMVDRFVAIYNITEREMEVITRVSQGCSNEDVAEQLHISLGTVKNHLHNVFRKTGVRNRMELCNLLKLR